jgi:hypothetical protein
MSTDNNKTADESRRDFATAEDVFNGEGGAAPSATFAPAPGRAPMAKREGTRLPTVDGAAKPEGLVEVIRRLRRGRWTLTEVYR